ncbi:UbiD family decarboxylase domain-containing protein [Chloroflexota bacterium]
MDHGGLDEFPIPISTPGFDSAPFFTSPYWVTKDPETNIRNVGTYRVHVKAPLRTGLFPASPAQDIARHWRKWKERSKPMPAAIIIGAAPNIGYVSVSKLPYNVDEFAVAGAIAGEPVELVKCKTVDLEVPTHAEIVFEGEVSTDEVEPEAPFGEFSGYMGQREVMPYFTIKCITHRREPIWQDFLSQFPPSESSMIRGVASENAIYKILREDLGIKEVTEVALHESTGSSGLMVIQLKRSDPPQAWNALEAFRERGTR